MNRQIRQLGVALLVLFAVLFIRLNQVQVFESEELTANALNTRRVIRDFGQRRGAIITSDGVVIAESVDVEGRFARQRRYPEGPLFAHLTGYFSFEYGATGVERSYNDELAGHTAEQRFESFFDFFGDGDTSGDIRLTIDAQLQEVAADQLGERAGSVVALDPRSGEVLAFYSWPTFDPNAVSSTNLEVARSAKLELDAAPGNPLLTRAHREVYPPGSTFKLITAASALENDRATPTEPVFDTVVDYQLPLTTVSLRNYGGFECGGDLATVIAKSCNTAFAELGGEYLGPELLGNTAERFGFNDELPFDLPLGAESRFPTDYGAVLGETDATPPAPLVEGTSLLAQAAIGQYDVRATPLQMAVTAAGIANDGQAMEPHVMASVFDAVDGGLVTETAPRRWRQVLSPEVATVLSDMMVGAVDDGTATSMARSGLRIGAKTGTAEVAAGEGDQDTHAWVVAFAGPEGAQPELAVAVLVEAVPGAGQQTGGAVAAPIASALIDQVFSG